MRGFALSLSPTWAPVAARPTIRYSLLAIALASLASCGDDGAGDGGSLPTDSGPGLDDTSDAAGEVRPDVPPDGADGDEVSDPADGDVSPDGSGVGEVGPAPDAKLDAEPDEGPDRPDSGYASDAMMVKIVAPGGGPREQVLGGVQQVKGVLFGEADEMSWEVSPGGESGGIQVGAYWSTGPIPLQPGDNTVVVTARKGERTLRDSVVITYNQGFLFDSGLRARPNVGWVGEEQEIVFTIPASLYGNFDASSMALVEVDEAGAVISTEGAMVDDGTTSQSGDEIEGDGVFTRTVDVECEDASPRWFRARVTVGVGANIYTAWSPSIPVSCLHHFTPNACDDHMALIQQAEAQFEEGSMEDVVAFLEAAPAVAEVGRAEGDGHTVWIRFQSGILGAVLLGPQGLRGSGDGGVDAVQPPDVEQSRQALAANVEDLGSKEAIVLAPFANAFGSTEDGPAVVNALSATECPTFAVEGGATLRGSAATLDRFRGLERYGIVSISTHGDALFGGMKAEAMEAYRWDHVGAQEVLWSGEQVQCNRLLQEPQSCTVSGDDPTGGCPAGSLCQVTRGSGGSQSSGRCLDRTQADLRLGRVILTNRGYAMTPEFFDAWRRDRYPNSLVNLGACRSMYNGSLAATFVAGGAKSVTGFSDYVDSGWARERIVEFFDGAVEGGLVGPAHRGGEDPSNPGTHWRLFGAGNLDLAKSEIVNASFEAGDITGWTQDGDGRVVTQLGASGPVHGKFMGLLSTGLGFTVETGTLEQDFCIPEDATEIEIHWRFFSEEFKQYCGTKFQDGFQAVLFGAGGQLTVVDVRVDDLCPYTENACGACPEPIACDFECMGGDSCVYDAELATCTGTYDCKCGKYYVGLTPSDVSFDQGGVFHTSWQRTRKDISALAGAGKVTLRLFATDRGDSILDTAVLVDRIRFN